MIDNTDMRICGEVDTRATVHSAVEYNNTNLATVDRRLPSLASLRFREWKSVECLLIDHLLTANGECYFG